MTNESKGKELEGIISCTHGLSPEHRRLADGVMNVFTRANRELMREVKENQSMCEAINELFAEETRIEKEKAEAAMKRAELAEARTGELTMELGEAKSKLGELASKMDEMAKQLQDALEEIARLKANAS